MNSIITENILKKRFYFKVSDFIDIDYDFVNILEKFNIEKYTDHYILFPYSINTDTRVFSENLNLIDILNKSSLKFIKIFICIKGENFDSHNFINDILKKDIDLVIIEDNFYKQNQQQILNLFKVYNKAFIVVSNSVKYLGLISRIFIKKIKQDNDIRIIGITGSAGKTTTKNLLFNLLSFFFNEKVVASKKSFNNEIGVPFTIFSINKDTQYLILEMGMRGFNQIEYLANISDIDYGIITSIGPAHILQVGNITGVNKAKGELIEYLIKNNKNFFILPKEYKIKEHIKNTNSIILPNKNYYIFKYNIINQENKFLTTFYLKFGKILKKFEIKTILSKGILRNFLMALVFINKLINLNLETKEKIKEKLILDLFNFIENDLFNQATEENRFNFKIKNNLFILDDCYNSNPLSMKENLNVIYKLINYFDKAYLVIGDMLELGKFSKFYHKLIFNKIYNILETNKNKVEAILVGSEFKKIKYNINNNYIKHFENVDNLLEYITLNLKKDLSYFNKKILVDIKASRAIQLEKVVNLILNEL